MTVLNQHCVLQYCITIHRRRTWMYFVPDSSSCQAILCLCVAVVSVVCLWAWRWGIFELTLQWNVQNVGEHKSEAADAAVCPLNTLRKHGVLNVLPIDFTHSPWSWGLYTWPQALDCDWWGKAGWGGLSSVRIPKLGNVDGAVFSHRCENTFLNCAGGAAAERGRNMTADTRFRHRLPAVIHTSEQDTGRCRVIRMSSIVCSNFAWADAAVLLPSHHSPPDLPVQLQTSEHKRCLIELFTVLFNFLVNSDVWSCCVTLLCSRPKTELNFSMVPVWWLFVTLK